MKYRERILGRSAARAALSIAAMVCTIGFAEHAQATPSWHCSLFSNESGVASFPVTALYSPSISQSLVFYTINDPITEDFSQFSYGTVDPFSWGWNQFDGPGYHTNANTYTAGITYDDGSVFAAYPSAASGPQLQLAVIPLSSPGSTPTYHTSNTNNEMAPSIPPSVVPYYDYNLGDFMEHIFYQQYVPSTGLYAVYEEKWDRDTGTWATGMTIDGGATFDATGPAAIEFEGTSGDTLRVFYYKDNQILEKVTSTGDNTNWSGSHVVSDPTVDAAGNPSVIVGPDGNLHVFYADSNGVLRESVSGPAGNFGAVFNVVDSTGDVTYASPILVNDDSVLELYYIDQSRGTLKEAAYTTSWSLSTIDGTSGSRCGSTNSMFGPPAAVSDTFNPQVYYFDGTAGTLRLAAYY